MVYVNFCKDIFMFEAATASEPKNCRDSCRQMARRSPERFLLDNKQIQRFLAANVPFHRNVFTTAEPTETSPALTTAFIVLTKVRFLRTYLTKSIHPKI